MSTETNLKKQYTPYLWFFFSFNTFFFLVTFFASYFELPLNQLKVIFTLRSSTILASPLILFVLNGMLSSNQKAILVFWRTKHPLPGSRAFSIHGLKDSRVDMSRLRNEYNPLPNGPEGENALWYRIYKKNISDTVVQKSHRDFLFARDLVAMSFLFIVFVGTPIMFLIRTWPSNFFYLLFLVLQYLILVKVAQNHGKRFVTNVLAIESAK